MVVRYTEQELVSIGNQALGQHTGVRASGYVGLGTMGYDYQSASRNYLKISSQGKKYVKRVARTARNTVALDAFKDTIDDIRSKEWSIVTSVGMTALGALVSGGIGSFALLTSSASLIGIGNSIIKLTERAQRYFWNV